MTKKPPFLLHLIALIFLFSALIYLLGIIGTIQSWNWMRVFETQPQPIYLVFKNAFLFLAAITAVVVLWLRLSWASWYGGIFWSISTIWFWIDRVVLTKDPLPFNRHLLTILISVLLLLLILGSCYLLVPYLRGNTNGGVEEPAEDDLKVGSND